jgi:hypothetical protein
MHPSLTMKAKMAHKKGRGRPASFKKEFVGQASKLCALGATDIELAEFFEVDTRTIYRWRNTNEDFCQAVIVGKEALDQCVERSLYQRATGYCYPSEKVFQYQGKVIRAPIVDHVPPDPSAATLWLKNRQPARWRDVQRHEVGAPGEFDHLTNQELEARILENAKRLGATPEAMEMLRLTFQPKDVIEGEAVADGSQAGVAQEQT